MNKGTALPCADTLKRLDTSLERMRLKGDRDNIDNVLRAAVCPQ